MLTGFSVRNAPQFEEWVRYSHRAPSGLSTRFGPWRAKRWLSGGGAGERGRRALDRERSALRRGGADLAVEALYLSGNRGGALARAVGYRDALYRETGCEPGRGFRALMQRVKADRPSSEARGSPMMRGMLPVFLSRRA